MKLSEAMILGHTLIGEVHNAFYRDTDLDGNPIPPCGCAIGSAAAAIGGTHEVVDTYWLTCKWPWTANLTQDYPALAARAPWVTGRVADAISEMHGYSRIPRLEIAEIIAQIEPDEEPVAEVREEQAVTA